MAGGAPIRISILANANQARREVTSFAGTLRKTLGAGAALAGAYGGVELLRSIAREGSESQQTLGGTAAVFKKHAAQVDASSRRAAKSVGLSANAYRTNATLLGSLLKGQGVAADKLAGKTNQLIRLGADLAATYGGTTKDAVEALTSAFKGEFDPIERYGVSLKQSIVTTEAGAIAQKRYGKALKSLSVEQQTAVKQQATYRLILGKTADAQGQFARESDTVAGKQQRLAAQIDNTKARLGTSLLPVLAEAADLAQRKLVPALDDFADWFDENIDEIAASGKSISRTFLPPLQAAAEVATAGAKALALIPPEVRELGVELLIAAKAYKVLTAAGTAATGSSLAAPIMQYRREIVAAQADMRSSTWQGALTQKAYREEVGKSAQTLRSQLMPAAASAAGVAGMGLLLTSTQQSNQGLNMLQKTAGGAATGFAVGGPLGAGIGGIAGMLWGARDAFNATEGATRRAAAEAAKTQSWKTAKAAALELQDALYGTRDAYNEVTAASVKKGLFADGKPLPWVKDLQAAGVNIDTITRSILGQRDAQVLVNQAFKQQDGSLAAQKSKIAGLRAELKTLSETNMGTGATEADIIRESELRAQLKQLTLAYDEARTAQEARDRSYGKLAGTTQQQIALERQRRSELGLTKQQYDAMPENVRTKIEANGLPQIKPALMDLLRMTNDLSGKQVVAFVRANGATLSAKQVAELQRRFKLTPKEVATLVKVNGANKAKADAAKAGRDAGSELGKSAASATKRSSAEVREAARIAVERARAAASRDAAKSSEVGKQITAGFAAGVGTGGAVAAATRRVIRDALAAARHEAEIRSPSRKAKKDGKNIAKGYAAGVREGWPDVRRAITDGMRSLFDRQTSPATQFLSDLRSTIRSSLKGKAEKRALAVVDQYSTRVRRAYAQWSKVTAQLEKARAKLEEMKQEAGSFRSSTESAVRGWFDPFRDALSEAAAFTDRGGLLGAVLGNARTQAAEISQTTQLLSQAMTRGLSKEAYERILALSPAEANKIATSLATATTGQVKELNGYFATVDSQARAAGSQAYNSFFRTGITAQQGIVDGLLKDKAAIERAADRLAREIERATNRRLRGKKSGRGKPKPRRSASVGIAARPTAREAIATVPVATAPTTPTVVNLNVTAPVGASGADIGREIASYLRAYTSIGGRL